MRSTVSTSSANRSWQLPTERIIKADPLKTIGEIAEEFNINCSMGVWHLKQIGKVKMFNKWVPYKLTSNPKIVFLKFPLILYNKLFLDLIVTWDKKWILYDSWWQPAQWLHHQCTGTVFSPHSCQYFLICGLFDDNHSDRCEVISPWCLGMFQHLFMDLLAVWISSLVKCLYRSFVCSLILSGMNCF